MKQPKPPARTGRPRSFDEDEALERAMTIFWQKGYEATSVSDLTAALGISPPSLYAAFGNKESLFERVLTRYANGPARYVIDALAAPTAREVAERRLHGAVEATCDPSRPRGCLAVQAAARSADPSSSVVQKLVAFCDRAHVAYVKRFERARKEGDLPKAADPAALARYVSTVAQGISIQAASGARRAELRQVAAIALRCWPE
ncbi:MAG TPA: TetR/AcrR family transcriptional regulator [Polyangiaceae bacterium]|nr:TetR/AcrR family transcriptional regulator [Polyangiaceae bacterium]